jgi:hypothetical protein
MSGYRTNALLRQMLLLGFLGMSMTACSPDVPGLGGANPVSSGEATGLAAPLSDAAFEALPVDDQYRVVNKLLSTLYNGVSVEEFYALEPGNSLVKRKDTALTPHNIKERLRTNLRAEDRQRFDQQIVGDDTAQDDQGNATPIEALFRFDGNKPKQMPLARIYHYPISRDAFSQWIAWNLANTILFSPAEELDSANTTDVQNVFRRLDLGIMQGSSIRNMVAVHQHSVENWRRFRSPEDNTREMMEIYLGIFDNDAEVPFASQACQDLYLTDERDGYKLAYTDYPNTEPVIVLDQYVTTCRDFYDIIANHPRLIPRIVSVLVDYFYAGHTANERLAITESISASNPVTFEDIFSTILFSESYLLDTERARSFEENFLPMAKRLQWDAHPDVFRGLISGNGSLGRAQLSQMGWSSMTYKLGRVAAIPLDSLSFGNYHKALRENLMLDSNRWRLNLGVQAPTPPDPSPVEPLPDDASARDIAAHTEAQQAYDEALALMTEEARQAYNLELTDYQQAQDLYHKVDDLTISQLLDYLFLSAVQRRPIDTERRDLITLLDSESHLDPEFDSRFVRNGRLDDVSLIVMDYMSRLPEMYFLNKLR